MKYGDLTYGEIRKKASQGWSAVVPTVLSIGMHSGTPYLDCTKEFSELVHVAAGG